MRTNTKKMRLRYMIYVALIVLGVAGIGMSVLYVAKLWPFSATPSNSSINYNPPTQEELSAGDNIKKNSETADGSDPSPSPAPSSDGGKMVVSMDITAANQDSSTLHIRTIIQTVSASGNCTLSISNSSGVIYTKNTGVQALPSTSTCSGFDVPLSSLSPGTWTITVIFENDSVKASTTKEIQIT